jgi:hypothetical protein
MSQYLIDDSGIGISVPVGTGNVTFTTSKYIRVAWDFPINAPDPVYFQIVVFTGSDPTDENAYLYPAFSVGGDQRVWVKATTYNGTATLQAAVRAVYFKG